MECYFHMFANGDDARNFITSFEEFQLAFNRVAVCQYLSGVKVLSFSIEDSHPHFLLFGSYKVCDSFRRFYETISSRSIAHRRGSLDGVNLHCELYEVSDESYLRNVAVYTIIQPTKDGKSVMPYDYLFGTGSLYFRPKNAVLPWRLQEDVQELYPLVRFGEMTYDQRRKICGSRTDIPDDWLICNGFILPTNYVDVKHYESIFRTHNCFRVFLSSGRDKYTVVLDKMAAVRGLMIDDLEARSLSEKLCMTLFGKKGTRHITPEQRMTLSRELHKRHGLSIRQISTLTKISEEELRKYLH